jgi:hypothetical protein
MWTQSQRAHVPEEAAVLVQNALGYTRMQISEGKLQAEDWYKKLDQKARDAYRKSSRDLLRGLMAYISDNEQVGETQAHALGYDYATIGRRHGLSSIEVTKAFLFFRYALLESMVTVYEASSVHSPYAWGEMLRKINKYADRILLSLLETYQAFERGNGI